MAIAEFILRIRDQASAALGDVSDAANDAASSLDQAGDEAADASGKFSRAGEAFGSVGGAAGKLAGGLDLLVPGLGEVASTVADMADVGEVGAAAMEGLGATVGLLAGVVGVAAASFAVLATAYAVVGNATSDQTSLTFEAAAAYVEADAAAAQLAGTVDALAAAQEASAAAFAAARDQIELLTGATTSYEQAAARAGASVRDAARGELDVLRERLRLQLDGLRQAEIVARSEDSTAEQRAQAMRQQKEYEAQVGATRLAIQNLKRTTEEQAGTLEGLILKEGLDAEEKRKQADAARAGAEAERARSSALKEAEAATKAAADAEAKRRAQVLADLEAEGEQIYGARGNPQIQFLTDFYSKLGQARSQTDLQGLLADLAVAMTRYGLSVEQVTAAQEALNAAMGQVPAKAPGTPGSDLDALGKAQATIGAAGSIAGLTKLDPSGISAAVVAGLQTAAGLGQGGGVLGEVTTLLADAAEGLPALGDELVSFTDSLLSEIIPSLIEGAAGAVTGVIDSLPDLVAGLLDSVPALLEAAIGSLDDLLIGLFRLTFTMVPEMLFAAVNVLLDPQFWIDVATAFLRGLLDALNVFKNEDNTGLLQREGVIGRTGAAIRDIFDGRDNGRIGETRIFNFNGVVMENLESAARQFRDLDRRGVRR